MRTGLDTRQRRAGDRGFARTAFVLEFLLLVLDDRCHRLFVHGVVRIFINNLEGPSRTSGHAIAATFAFVSINGNEIISGTVAVSVISQHARVPSL